MPDGPATNLDHAALPDRPASFAERGVAVPFTSALLSAARLRRGARGQPELLLPALGGRGVYVQEWSACLANYAPSLHDRALWQLLAQVARPNPAAVRAAARQAAALGYGGRAAQAAAARALREQQAMSSLVRGALAARLGGTSQPQLEWLAAVISASGGLPPADATRPMPRPWRGTEVFSASLAASVAAVEEPQTVALRRAADLVLGAVRLTLVTARAVLDHQAEALDRLLHALASGQALPEAEFEAFQAVSERSDWLLDGWPVLAARWDMAAHRDRLALLPELVGLLPLPPQEVENWPGPRAAWDTLLRARRVVPVGPVAGSLGTLDLVARNEALRALAP